MFSGSGSSAHGDDAAGVPLCLEVRGPGDVVSYVALASPRLLIGRRVDCQVRLDRPEVSGHHAELFCDPWGRWWIHDLGSRNGTKVNGVRVLERALRLTDAVEIKPFALRLHQAASSGVYDRAAALEVTSLTEGDFQSISSLAEHTAPKVALSQLSLLTQFGRELIQIEQPERRLEALCGLMVSPRFGGRLAVALRLRLDVPNRPPERLCRLAMPRTFRHMTPYISASLLRAVRERKEPVLGSNAGLWSADVVLTPPQKGRRPVSAAACPLRVDERTMDVLYVVFPPEFGTSEWLGLVSLAAEQFEQAEFAWTARRQAESHAAIEHELEQAREIQMRLIRGAREVRVAGLDVGIGFEPCRWVGGDYVDVVPLANGRALVIVADVCGKGLHAAMVAVGVRSMVRSVVTVESDLPRLVQHLNDHLCEDLPDDSFVTMVCAMIDPRTGTIEMVNSGHPPAALVDRREGLRWLQSGVNLPLGISPAAFECQKERIETGEMLAMFTDGLTDVGPSPNRHLGLEPLANQLRSVYAGEDVNIACDVADRLTVLVAKAHGSGLASDDRTFLLARRTEMH